MKTALITGGSRGIGSAICKELSANHKVVIGYSNSKEEAKITRRINYFQWWKRYERKN